MESRGQGSSSRGTGGGASGGTRGARGSRRGRRERGNTSNGKGKRPRRSPSEISSSSPPTGAGGRRGVGGARGGGDGDSYSTLGKLVSKATKPTRETGYRYLDEDTVRRIKAIARKDDNCAGGAIHYLMQRMTAKSSEVRFMVLSIVGLLFQRSRVVRKVLAADLKNFMNLAVGHDARQPLPGPPAAAAALRQKALGLLEEWNGSHGDLYKGLRAAYRFLREGKRMKFPELQARAARERQAAERRLKHAQRLLRAKYLQAKAEIAEQAPEIETMVREMQECFAILVPAVPGSDAISVAGVGGGNVDGSAPYPEGKGGGTGGGGSGSSGSSGGNSLSRLPSGHDVTRTAQTPAALVAAAAVEEENEEEEEEEAVAKGGGHCCRGDGDGVGGTDEERRSSSSRRDRNCRDRPGGGVDGRRCSGGSSDDKEGARLEKQRPPQKEGESGGREDGPDQRKRPDAGERGEKKNEEEEEELEEEQKSLPPPTGGVVDDDADDSDDDEGMEWEDGGGGGDIGEGGEEGNGEEEEKGKENEDRGCDGGDDDTLRTIADTVEAAGLGTSGYELQVEVPMGWSVTTTGGDGSGGGRDAALVVPALRERYKVLTSRLLPLLSDWIQTLSRVRFDNDNDDDDGDGDGAIGGGGGPGRLGGRATTAAIAAPAMPGPSTSASVLAAETRACASFLSRCLATRNSANSAVSKFLELRIDEEVEGGGGRGDRGRGAGSTAAASTAPAAKKPRLQIRMGGLQGRDEGVWGGVK